MRVKDTLSALRNGLELRRVKLIFMPGQKILNARSTAQEIGGRRFSETQRRGSALLAKDDHVHKGWVLRRRGALVEDPACREGVVDCADDESSRVEGDVASVVLQFMGS